MSKRNQFSRHLIIMLCLSAFLGGTTQSYAGKVIRGLERLPQQHALVVGINKYQHAGQLWDAEGTILKNLNGAVNDAKLLTEALRHAQIKLPAQRILINANATRANFVRAWQNMVKQAKPRDTLIVTFAGHGIHSGGQHTSYTNGSCFYFYIK